MQNRGENGEKLDIKGDLIPRKGARGGGGGGGAHERAQASSVLWRRLERVSSASGPEDCAACPKSNACTCSTVPAQAPRWGSQGRGDSPGTPSDAAVLHAGVLRRGLGWDGDKTGLSSCKDVVDYQPCTGK